MSAAKLMATELAPEIAAMLVKKLGKPYTRKIRVTALVMDMPFKLGDLEGETGDYLILDDGGVSMVKEATFKTLFGVARRGRKRRIPPTLQPTPPTPDTPPGAYSVNPDIKEVGAVDDPDHSPHPAGS